MSKGSKKHYKQFPITSTSDACLVIMDLISRVTVNINKYEEYANELQELIQKYEKNICEVVSAKEFEDIKDKLLMRQHELLKFIADEQTSSFSYKNVRRILVKNGYLTEELHNELSELLNEYLNVRNWTFHNTQSMLVATQIDAERNIPDFLKGKAKVIPQCNPVVIPVTVSYTFEYVISYFVHVQTRLAGFKDILIQMKKDYQVIYDRLLSENNTILVSCESNEVEYVIKEIKAELGDSTTNIAQLSMAIQKSKYDGSDESYEKTKLSL